MIVRRVASVCVAVCALVTGRASSQTRAPGTVVIVTGQFATSPVPTTMEGAQSTAGNQELSDQLFLRLANLGPDRRTADERSFQPALARKWERLDSLTIAIELDPGARWQDGRPVVANDVVYTFARARDPKVAPKLANLLRHLSDVTADGDRRVVFRFSRAYPEQFYDIVFHASPLPSHLLGPPSAEIPRDFIASPVGSGPYRIARSLTGQYIELVANPNFLFGPPKVSRVLFRVASDPEARMNLLLSEEADAIENVPGLIETVRRFSGAAHVRAIALPSSTMGYLLFNQRDRADRSRPHPILGDARVRRAIRLALDRQAIVRATFDRFAAVPYGPVSQLLWIRDQSPAAERQNLGEARRLLASLGWTDSDGDGVLDRNGVPLALGLNYPLTSEVRRKVGLLVQEQLRAVGIQIELVRLEGAVWSERRTRGDFDIDFSSVLQDPTPSGLTQGWSCDGGTNVAKYCNPKVDSLLERAMTDPSGGSATWQAALQLIEEDAPAVFMYAPLNVYPVSRRLHDVRLRPESPWIQLWSWRAG
ncbi:MAG TPA: peptide ABC transporter substrate-binding protein [Gemmatimonadales bacterium]|nr:peptide ABC transporter substrate-binding protein [Gemmatimonadales bacterium]